MAYRIFASLTILQYPLFRRSPSGVPMECSHPGSLKYTYSLITMDWIEMRICSSVETYGIQLSPQVPSRLRQTLPQLYKLGLKRTLPCPVVSSRHLGGRCG